MSNIRVPEVFTMDDFDFDGKKVLVRVDFNSPINPRTGEIIDDSRIKEHSVTIDELATKGAAVVIMSHQGRPGGSDFITLEQHAKILSELVSVPVKFIDDVCGPAAKSEILKLKPGHVLVLDNVRFHSEEVIERPPGVQAKTYLVKRLAPLFDIFVLDAFAAAHRSQPSLVGFPMVLPSCAGRVLEKEIKALQKMFSSESKPIVFVLGGAKLSDSIRIIEHLLKNDVADHILATGLLSLLLLHAKGVNIGDVNVKTLEDVGALSLTYRIKGVLEKYDDKIMLPKDYAVEEKGERVNKELNELTGKAKDIGEKTIEEYSNIIRKAKVVVFRGPAGVIEEPIFQKGSVELAKAAVKSKAFTIFGGGHMRVIAEILKSEGYKNIGHLSTGGGALLTFLSGKPLPALEALEISLKMFKGVKV